MNITKWSQQIAFTYVYACIDNKKKGMTEIINESRRRAWRQRKRNSGGGAGYANKGLKMAKAYYIQVWNVIRQLCCMYN